MSFQPFPKIGRLSRECVITEKIDGTNAQVFIAPTVVGSVISELAYGKPIALSTPDEHGLQYAIYAGSRTRFIYPGKNTDNSGFAGWVRDNAEELAKLGEGQHYGEWWGKGIQRGYGLTEKRFSLFNVHRWNDDAVRPKCCHVVPTLYTGMFSTIQATLELDRLYRYGSRAAPGFMKPEGIIVFHTANGTLFKKTIEGDEAPKSLAMAA